MGMKPKSVLLKFQEIFPRLTSICNQAGYALAHHGSLARDIDLVAIPWTEEAVDAEELARRIVTAHCTPFSFPWWTLIHGNHPDGKPTQKPHGRLCWSIWIDETTYIDLSVMPRKVEA